MFVLIDTNHLRELRLDSAAGRRLRDRIISAKADVFTSVVVAEEALQGRIAYIRKLQMGQAQLVAYELFQECLEVLKKLVVLPFDKDAATVFHLLQVEHRHVGRMDLKIAATCLSLDAVLLTRNLRDFEKIEGLRVENWLD